MNPCGYDRKIHRESNSREYHFERRKAEVKRLMAAGHTKKRAQQIAKDKGF